MKQVMKITTIIGARPQFIKAASISRAFEIFNKQNNKVCFMEDIIHTGQHYDKNMSKVFFEELGLSCPKINLKIGSGLHGQQTGAMLEQIERNLINCKPDYVLIYGDTNSTLAAALAAIKLHIPIAHVESGLRSFNRCMPEEINRIVADQISSLLFCPTETSVENLAAEGITKGVHLVGDIMYDSVLYNTSLAEHSSKILEQLALDSKSYYLATIHRAENTDNKNRLENILNALRIIDAPIVLPMHPRTKKTLGAKLHEIELGVKIIDPVSYLDMLTLEKNARVLLTDSGGVQKEAYWFSVPCVTLRDETEWIELVESGYNCLVGAETEAILAGVEEAEEKVKKVFTSNTSNLYGDGQSAEKIVAILSEQSIN